jgi:hypothetical protein
MAGGAADVGEAADGADALDSPTDALARAINAHGHEPVRDPRIESLRARAKEGDKAVKRLRQIEANRWWQVGQRAEAAMGRVRRRRGPRREGS